MWQTRQSRSPTTDFGTIDTNTKSFAVVIDTLKGPQGVQVKMHQTNAEDTITNAESNTRFGPIMTKDVGDRHYPIGPPFIHLHTDGHLTFIADNDCTIIGRVLSDHIDMNRIHLLVGIVAAVITLGIGIAYAQETGTGTNQDPPVLDPADAGIITQVMLHTPEANSTIIVQVEPEPKVHKIFFDSNLSAYLPVVTALPK